MMGGTRAEKQVVMEMVATKGVAATVSEGVVRAYSRFQHAAAASERATATATATAAKEGATVAAVAVMGDYTLQSCRSAERGEGACRGGVLSARSKSHTSSRAKALVVPRGMGGMAGLREIRAWMAGRHPLSLVVSNSSCHQPAFVGLVWEVRQCFQKQRDQQANLCWRQRRR